MYTTKVGWTNDNEYSVVKRYYCGKLISKHYINGISAASWNAKFLSNVYWWLLLNWLQHIDYMLGHTW